jgi:hypothetical protein
MHPHRSARDYAVAERREAEELLDPPKVLTCVLNVSGALCAGRQTPDVTRGNHEYSNHAPRPTAYGRWRPAGAGGVS